MRTNILERTPRIPLRINPAFEPGMVSCIIPTHNRSEIIRETLESVKAQTYRPIEIIVSDDGSTDDTREMVPEWIRNNCFDGLYGQYIYQQKGGVNVARNSGLAACRGEFIQFLDSDDLIHRAKFELSVGAMRKENAEIASGRILRFAETKDIADQLDGQPPPKPHDREPEDSPFITRPQWHTASPLFSRGILLEAGLWDVELHLAEEYEYYARIKCLRPKVVHLPYLLIYYRVGLADSQTRYDSEIWCLQRHLSARKILAALTRNNIKDPKEYNYLAMRILQNGYRSLKLPKTLWSESIQVAYGASRMPLKLVLLGLSIFPNQSKYFLGLAVAVRGSAKARVKNCS